MLRLIFLLFLLTGNTAFAQPANDECNAAEAIGDIANWCSGAEAYTTIGATSGNFGAASCFSGANNDVWFRIKATATDVTIIIRGNDPASPGGSLQSPEVALYTGSCGGILNTEACAAAPAGLNVVSLHKGGLQLGGDYLIRVQGKSGFEGSFELCITNYNPPVDPGQDCVTASQLCDASSFTVQQISGGGNNPDEASGTCIAVESASTWFSWTAANSGNLTFTLTPTNAPDDLDFVVYELPVNGGCANKIPLLCNAAGESFFPSPCMGPTGLNASSTDATEWPGCGENNDGWLKPLEMQEGKRYALLVNNYSASGSGFTMDFGGSGMIAGPQIDFKTDKTNDEACFGDSFVFSDKSTSINNSIALWEWNFGLGATPLASTGQGPHTVTYDTPGTKLVSLKITSSNGCVLTKVKQIEVLPCCETVNDIEVTPNVTNLKCDGGSDGAISLNVSTNAMPVAYNWGMGGPSVSSQSNLVAGSYGVTVTNLATCEASLTYELTSPPPMVFDTIIQKPTCGGGQDGVLELPTTGGVSPYEYSFDGSPFSASNTLKNISSGLVTVGVRDANGCLITLEDLLVTELELLLNPNVVAVDTPSCFGFNDGNITLGVLNGVAPFQYDFGTGFGASNVLENVVAGTYNVEVLDANLCKGTFQFGINDYPPMTLTVSGDSTSCYGLSDGSASANAGGGVGDYSYLWSNQEVSSINNSILAGSYFVTATDGNNCEIVESIVIGEPEKISIFIVGIDGVICFGDKTGTVGLKASGGSEPYLFAIDASIFQQDTAFANIQGGGHTVYVQDVKGCIGKDSVYVPQPAELIVEVSGDTTVALGHDVPVGAIVFPQGSLVDYRWFPNGGQFNNDSIPSPILRPMSTSYYYVQVTDTAGCTALDSVLIEVNPLKPVFGPTAFSPNNDGVNDFFTIYGGPAAVHILSLRIFDRFGNMVFEKSDYSLSQESTGWDGRFKGKKMRSDTYVWMAEVDFWDGKPVIVSGDVTLVR